MPYIDFAQLKQEVSITDVFPMLNLDMTEKGNQWRGECPACQKGGDRALVVTPAKEAFYCFPSRSGGDVIALAAHIFRIPIRDAALAIAEQLGTVRAPEGNSSPGKGTSSRKGTVPEREGGQESGGLGGKRTGEGRAFTFLAKNEKGDRKNSVKISWQNFIRIKTREKPKKKPAADSRGSLSCRNYKTYSRNRTFYTTQTRRTSSEKRPQFSTGSHGEGWTRGSLWRRSLEGRRI